MSRAVTLLFVTLAVGLNLVNSQGVLSAKDKATVESINSGIETFSLQLLLRVAIDAGQNENIVISPISVWSMLSVLTEGANGRTLGELESVLRHPINQPMLIREGFKIIVKAFLVNTSTVQLESTNSIFVDQKKQIRQQYEDIIRKSYLTEMHKINFRDANAANFINDRINKATRGKITEIVNKDDLNNAEMIITNAVFFKGQWTLPFNASLTKREPFYDEDNKKILGYVRMMSKRAAFPYVNMMKFQCHVVELPYGADSCGNNVDEFSKCVNSKGEENRLSMIIMLPHYGIKLVDLYKKFLNFHIKEVFEELKTARMYEDDEVDVYLPRFNISSDITMNQILINMGIYDVFDPTYADLSLMSNSLFLSRVIHKAKIEVNEEGTEASAITEGELSNRNTPPKFLANKPFIYLIIEKSTNIIVFSGVYKVPQEV